MSGMRIGIAPGVTKLWAGKVMTDDGGGDSDMLFRGIDWADGPSGRQLRDPRSLDTDGPFFLRRRGPRSSGARSEHDDRSRAADQPIPRRDLSPLHLQLDASDAKSVACREVRALHAAIVDECAVRAREVHHFHVLFTGLESAVQPGDERGIDDKIGPPSAPYRLDGTRFETKEERPIGRLAALQDPHGAVS